MSEQKIIVPNIGDFKEVEVIEVLVREGQKIKKDDYKFLNFTDHKKENYSTCLSPWTSVHVNVDGNVFPCMAFPIGNVKKQSMEEIYFSKISETFKREIKKCGTLPGCNRCGWLKPKVY